MRQFKQVRNELCKSINNTVVKDWGIPHGGYPSMEELTDEYDIDILSLYDEGQQQKQLIQNNMWNHP